MTNKELLNAVNEGTLEVSDSSVALFISADTYNALMTLLSTANDTEENNND